MALLKIFFLLKNSGVMRFPSAVRSRTEPEAPGSMVKKHDETVIQCDVKVIKKSNIMLRI